MNIGVSIKICLAKTGMSKGDLARAVGIYPNSLSRVLKKEMASIELIQKIAGIFGMGVSEFIALGESPNDQKK